MKKDETQARAVREPIESTLIIGERIDGPANVRDKPNGEVLFELNDHALVEVSTKPENGWYQVLVYADIEFNEYGMDSILKYRPIMVDNDTVGRILKSHGVGTGRGKDLAYAMLWGYTHEDNIKPETVIEHAFKQHLADNGRRYPDWAGFIESFQLDDDAIGYKPFNTFFNYENTIEDPSPGFRIVLLFAKDRLVGLLHSRAIEIDHSKTHTLNGSYHVTFFADHPENEQLEFVSFMNEWIQGVD